MFMYVCMYVIVIDEEEKEGTRRRGCDSALFVCLFFWECGNVGMGSGSFCREGWMDGDGSGLVFCVLYLWKDEDEDGDGDEVGSD